MAVKTSPSDSAKYFAIDVLGSKLLAELLGAAAIPEGAIPIGFRVMKDMQTASRIHVEILCSTDSETGPRKLAVRVDVERLLQNPTPLLRKILEKFMV